MAPLDKLFATYDRDPVAFEKAARRMEKRLLRKAGKPADDGKPPCVPDLPLPERGEEVVAESSKKSPPGPSRSKRV